jgi:hypothetical protein
MSTDSILQFDSKSEATGHTVYKADTCSLSTCAKLLSGETWSIAYSDHSSSSGLVYSDTVTIGGAAVPNQTVEAANKNPHPSHPTLHLRVS